jgi:hypothetical protein
MRAGPFQFGRGFPAFVGGDAVSLRATAITIMMKTLKLAAVVTTVGFGFLISASRGWAQTPNVVIQWNQILQTLFGTGPSPALRSLPMMHIAMFDAINSIEDRYTPYRVHVDGSHGALADAAAAMAAHNVLTALYPTQQATFDSALATQVANMPPGLVLQGFEVGQQAAQAVLTWRTNDGWPATITPDPAYVLPPFPGLWQPTPPANSFATFTFYPRVTPFALLTATQYLPPPPPTLLSARYAADFNEVKQIGSATSTSRSAEDTLLAPLFAGVNTTIGFFHVWNIVAAKAAQAQGLTLLDTARLFVLVNVSIHDGLMTSFTGKFIYGLWRPVTAIRRADEDLNADTLADAGWTPLLTTPTYPSYPGNVACLSAAAARALKLGVGRDDVPFTITWPRTGGLPSVTRDFTGFKQLADQQAESRINGGIHYRFDNEASQVACANVAEFTFANYMLRK